MLNFHFLDTFMNYFVGYRRSFAVFISNIVVGNAGLYDQQNSCALSDQKITINALDR